MQSRHLKFSFTLKSHLLRMHLFNIHCNWKDERRRALNEVPAHSPAVLRWVSSEGLFYLPHHLRLLDGDDGAGGGVLLMTPSSDSWIKKPRWNKRWPSLSCEDCPQLLGCRESNGGRAQPSITHPCLKWEEESVASTHHSCQGFWEGQEGRMNECVKA